MSIQETIEIGSDTRCVFATVKTWIAYVIMYYNTETLALFREAQHTNKQHFFWNLFPSLSGFPKPSLPVYVFWAQKIIILKYWLQPFELCHCWFKMPFVIKDSPVTLNAVFPARALVLIYAKWNYTCVLIPPLLHLPKQHASVFSCHNNLSCLMHSTGTLCLPATSA